MPAAHTRPIAFSRRSAACGSPRCSSICAAVQKLANGLAVPSPAIPKAEPWIGSNMEGLRRSGSIWRSARSRASQSAHLRDPREYPRAGLTRRLCRGCLVSASCASSSHRPASCPAQHRESPARPGSRPLRANHDDPIKIARSDTREGVLMPGRIFVGRTLAYWSKPWQIGNRKPQREM